MKSHLQGCAWMGGRHGNEDMEAGRVLSRVEMNSEKIGTQKGTHERITCTHICFAHLPQKVSDDPVSARLQKKADRAISV